MAYEPREIDYKNIDTRLGARRTSQEDLDAARVQASGVGKAEGYRDEQGAAHGNPEFTSWANEHLKDIVSRTVSGPPQKGGNLTNYTLSHGQFAQWKETGAWEGHPEMPTEEQATAPDPSPDHREWTPL